MSRSAPRYYEAMGQLRKQIIEQHGQMRRAMTAMLKFAKRFGCKSIALRAGFSTSFHLVQPAKPVLSVKLWRRYKPGWNEWQPRMTCPEGRALRKEMDEISSQYPSRNDLQKLLLASNSVCWDGDGLVWHQPGSTVVGPARQERVFVIYADPRFKPSDPKQLKRISDLEFEAATEKKKRKAKSRG